MEYVFTECIILSIVNIISGPKRNKTLIFFIFKQFFNHVIKWRHTINITNLNNKPV